MSPTCEFTVREHRLPGQHIREYEHGLADEEKDYFIHIKQYTPVTDRCAGPDDLTIIGAAGIGMVKEVYEPFFQMVTGMCMDRGIFVRNFWIADVGCVGKSALINADNLGREQSWWDHSRDLLLMINTFRDQMPRPLYGLGHSMGGCQIAFLSILHPHLLHSIILIEPAIYPVLKRDEALAVTKAMSRRRQQWSSKAAAEAAIRDNPFYNQWHPLAVQRLIENTFISPDEAPVLRKIIPTQGSGQVVSTTPRDMELALILRPNYKPSKQEDDDWIYPFERPEPSSMLQLLPSLCPSVCYIVGEKSNSSLPHIRQLRMETTGTAVQKGRAGPKRDVVERVVAGGGHYILLNKHYMSKTAQYAAEWLVKEASAFVRERQEDAEWRQRPVAAKIQPEPVIVDALDAWHARKAPDIEHLIKSRL